MGGLDTALSEITLVLFTTLAPSGALAFAFAGLPVVLGRIDGEKRRKLDRALCIPLVVALLGLVASATHLGNPANALYVFAGVGRSPLSNEVLAAVVFLGLAGLWWLYSFAERPRRAVQRVWLAVTGVAALAFVWFIGVAYDVATVPTWSTPTVPANLVLSAAVGGPVLAAACLQLAGYTPVQGRAGVALLVVAACALTGNLVVLGVQGSLWDGMANELATARELVGGYGAFVAGYGILGAAGIALAAWGLLNGGRATRARDGGGRPRGSKPSNGAASGGAGRRETLLAFGGSALVFAGIFLTRFAFYMGHMTV